MIQLFSCCVASLWVPRSPWYYAIFGEPLVDRCRLLLGDTLSNFTVCWHDCWQYLLRHNELTVVFNPRSTIARQSPGQTRFQAISYFTRMTPMWGSSPAGMKTEISSSSIVPAAITTWSLPAFLDLLPLVGQPFMAREGQRNHLQSEGYFKIQWETSDQCLIIWRNSIAVAHTDGCF